MSNGVRIFSNMKSYIFLIILLGFTRITICSQIQNITEEDVCPVSWFRRKRANGDYTRWRWDLETTPEFIVKVLDDEITTKKLVGVNIVPPTKRSERIIVGATLPVTAKPSSLPRDYTRFVPPIVSITESVQATTPALFHDAILPTRKESNAPKFLSPNLEPNPYRDESPPASPQFLPRAPLHPPGSAPTRQYAPIAPVSFTRYTTGTPLTPPSYDIQRPTHSRRPSTVIATRTAGILDKLDDFPIFGALTDLEEDNQITRTSPKGGPVRTLEIKTESPDYELDHFLTSPIRTLLPQHQSSTVRHAESEFGEADETQFSHSKNNIDGEKDNNMFFYNTPNKENNHEKELEISSKNEYVDKEENLFVTKNNAIIKSNSADISNRISIEESDESLSIVGNKTADVQYPEDNTDTKTNDKFIGTEELKKSSLLPENKSKDTKHPVCNIIKLRPLNFNVPRTLPEIVDQLKHWTEVSPVAKWAEMTGGNLTTMENPIYIIIVDDPSVGQVASEKQNVLLVAGIHGRDHHAVSSAMYILYQLTERSDAHQDVLSKYRFWVIPVLNPDGYDYSMTFPHRRGWIKNLRQTWEPCKGRESCQQCSSYGIRCTVSPCCGVNLDRNFEYQWIPPDELRAEHPCGNLYAGTRQMSEVETQALNYFIQEQKITISMFLAFKEGDVLGVMYPYSHTKKRRAFDQIYRQRAGHAAAAASSITGRQYIAGQTSEFLPLYAGGIEDWADGHLGIDSTYTVIMFRPTDTPNSKYLTERVIHEAYAAVDSLLLSSLTHGDQTHILTMAKSEASTSQASIFAVSLTSLASFLFNEYIT